MKKEDFMNPKIDTDFLTIGADKDWLKVEDDVLKRLSEERCFDGDIWAFKSLFKKVEVKRVGGNGIYTLEYRITLDGKKYFFSFEKRQGIWFLIEFKEI
jgi:hypothetical protein